MIYSDDAKDEAIKCVEDVINLFGGCDIDDERSKAIEVIIYRSRRDYAPAVEECFNGITAKYNVPFMPQKGDI